MLEVIIWSDAYPKSRYQFSWDIADIVSTGERPDTINYVDDYEMKQLIEQCWCQEPKSRLEIGVIVQRLERIWRNKK